MIFRRKPKIIKKGKVYPYGRRTTNVETSIFDGMSLIETITVVLLPCIMCFMFYIFLSITGLSWWLKFIVAVCIVVLLFSLVYWIVSWISGRSL